jgi:hypothetical protein
LEDFRGGLGVKPETELRGRRCAYFVHSALELAPRTERSWHLLADVNQDSVAIVGLSNKLRGDRSELCEALEQDIALNGVNLATIVARADGLQVSGDSLVLPTILPM